MHFYPGRESNSVKAITYQRKPWKEVLKDEKPLILPVAHDALAARLIERAGLRVRRIEKEQVSTAGISRIT